ncbi:restriction endonuclease subunit S [Streptococcus cristatus]|uniref:restriction endonuclease subunit S n=1 Tax=Streptococcus cristatus TaxID=45634 RepID=UPI000FB57065|nr:restriction endonuclease subunit S [Streptococcus cristatus]RSJ72831.1 Type I restriction modification DNA specificity domain protein [Streptococcus cristatus]
MAVLFIPYIRFNKFDNKWFSKKLDLVSKVTMGQSPDSKNYTDNPNDYILVQGNADMQNGRVVPRVWTTQITKLAEKGDLILSVRAPVGDIGKTDYNVVLGRGVAAIKGNEFLFQLLTKMKQSHYWAKFSTGSTFESINSNDIKSAEIYLPSPEEQSAIGSLFRTLDDLLVNYKDNLANYQSLKVTMLSKVFPKAGHTVPEIRLDGFEGEWEINKLNKYLTVSKKKNTKQQFGKEDVLSVSGEVGIVNQIQFQGRSFAGVSVEMYSIVETGNIVYTKSPLKANPYGIIKTNYGIPGIVSTLYAVYLPNENVFPGFVERYFENDLRLNSYLKPLVNKGAKNDMKVSDENALLGNVIFPKLEEQIAISDYFTNLDKFIQSHKDKISQLETLKKKLLQDMFI